MKISIITVCFNSAETIRDAIESVLKQSFDDIEYIIIDGNSTDGTCAIIQEYSKLIDVFISEPDRGLWNAMNKGLAHASGDYVGFLNSDDFFADSNVVESVANRLHKGNLDATFGYVDIVNRKELTKVVRRYRVGCFSRAGFIVGLMPAHPTFYCNRSFFERYGGFSEDPSVTPDFELMVRFLMKGGVKAELLPKVLVKMRNEGLGNSSWSYRLARYRKQARSCQVNGLWTNPLIIALKIPYKALEYIRKS